MEMNFKCQVEMERALQETGPEPAREEVAAQDLRGQDTKIKVRMAALVEAAAVAKAKAAAEVVVEAGPESPCR